MTTASVAAFQVHTTPAGLPAGGLAQMRSLIERRLDTLVPPAELEPLGLQGAMRHVLLAPGKRLRPLLTLATAIELGADRLALLDVGCALEMVHAASLVLDDLPCMDDATLRRGLPATHVAFGEDTAILAAIALLSRAFGLVASQRQLPAPVRNSINALLAESVGSNGLAGGQLDDLRGVQLPCDAATVEQRNLRKTGVLFVAAVESAAIFADARGDRLERLRQFAEHLGAAFQICDDLLDATASADAIGKDVQQDAERCTIVTLVGVDGARRAMHEQLLAAWHIAATLAGGAAVPAEDRPLAQFLHAAFGAELRAALGVH